MAPIQSIQERLHPQSGTHADGTAPLGATGRAAAPTREAAPGAGDQALDPKVAEEFARKVQETISRVAPRPHEVIFRLDEASNGFVIEIRNPDGSVVRQYPPEKLLNLRRRLDELSGMVIDEMT
jgi:flagellar protein FlaG